MTSLRNYKLLLTLLCFLVVAACSDNTGSLALGTLERDRIVLSATAGEIITSIPVEVGQAVNAGDILVQLDGTAQSSRVDLATAEIARASAYLQQLQKGALDEEIASVRARVENAEATLQNSEKNFTRVQSLKAEKMLGQADLDHALAQRDSSRANLKDSKQQLALLTRGTRSEKLAQAQAQLDAATSNLALETKGFRDLTVKATRQGTIDSLPWKLGERVNSGSPVVIILADGAPYARVYIPEKKRALLTAGIKLPIHIDGIDKAFIGTLKKINSEPAFTPYYALSEKDRSRLVYLAEFSLDETNQNLPLGIPVQVEMP